MKPLKEKISITIDNDILLKLKDRAEFDKFGNILKQGFYEIKDFEDFRQNFEKIIIKKEDFLSSSGKIYSGNGNFRTD